jgi:ankyrin repeat protein
MRELVWIVLSHVVDVNVQSNEKVTRLHFASVKRQLAVAQVLLEHGADVNVQDKDDQTRLHWAHGEEVSRVLLEHGADANAQDIKGRTSLHQASESGRLGAARVLLEHGVDVNSRDANHATYLHLASRPWYRRGGHPDVVQLLLQYGADIHARDDRGQTPFTRVTSKGAHNIMQLLLAPMVPFSESVRTEPLVISIHATNAYSSESVAHLQS